MSTEIRIEPYRGRWLDEVLTILTSSLTADPMSRSAFIRKALLDPNVHPNGLPVALRNGSPVGVALAVAPGGAERSGDRVPGYITMLGVAPDARFQGAGSALLAACEAHLRDCGCSHCQISPYPGGYLTPGVDIRAYAGGLEFLKRRGYGRAGQAISMECDLTGLTEPHWLGDRVQALEAAGIVLEPYRPEMIPPLLDFLGATFSADWQRYARQTAERIELGDSPERLIVARLGDEVVGMSHFDGERFGPIGVSLDHRGRGLGHALMYRTLRAMRSSGYHTAWFLWSGDSTAQRLYNGAGFRVRRRFAIMQKELNLDRAG